MAPRDGFEPSTNGLTVRCSTAELPGNALRRAQSKGRDFAERGGGCQGTRLTGSPTTGHWPEQKEATRLLSSDLPIGRRGRHSKRFVHLVSGQLPEASRRWRSPNRPESPADRVPAAHADHDAFDAPRADFQPVRGRGERHAAADDEIPDLQGVCRRRTGRFAGHRRLSARDSMPRTLVRFAISGFRTEEG